MNKTQEIYARQIWSVRIKTQKQAFASVGGRKWPDWTPLYPCSCVCIVNSIIFPLHNINNSDSSSSHVVLRCTVACLSNGFTSKNSLLGDEWREETRWTREGEGKRPDVQYIKMWYHLILLHCWWWESDTPKYGDRRVWTISLPGMNIWNCCGGTKTCSVS